MSYLSSTSPQTRQFVLQSALDQLRAYREQLKQYPSVLPLLCRALQHLSVLELSERELCQLGAHLNQQKNEFLLLPLSSSFETQHPTSHLHAFSFSVTRGTFPLKEAEETLNRLFLEFHRYEHWVEGGLLYLDELFDIWEFPSPLTTSQCEQLVNQLTWEAHHDLLMPLTGAVGTSSSVTRCGSKLKERERQNRQTFWQHLQTCHHHIQETASQLQTLQEVLMEGADYWVTFQVEEVWHAIRQREAVRPFFQREAQFHATLTPLHVPASKRLARYFKKEREWQQRVCRVHQLFQDIRILIDSLAPYLKNTSTSELTDLFLMQQHVDTLLERELSDLKCETVLATVSAF